MAILKDQSNNQTATFSLDIKRSLYALLVHWYVVLGFIVLSFAIAIFNYRYVQQIYPVGASIIYLGKEETSSGADLLYKNALINSRRNYLNEPYLMRAEFLVRKVVDELNFDVSFFAVGRVVATEVYNLPFKLKSTDSSSELGGQYFFTVVDKQTYLLEKEDENEKIVKKETFKFGKKATFDAHNFQTDTLSNRGLHQHIGTKYKLVFRSIIGVADEYVGKTQLKWAEEGAAVMNISLVGPTPEKEIDFIKGLVSNYQIYDLDKKSQVANRTAEFLENQLKEISDSLRLFEAQMEQFKRSNRTNGDLGAEALRMYSKVEGFEVQIAELSLRNTYFNYLESYLAKENDLEQVILPNSMGITDPILGAIVSKIGDLQLELKLFVDQERATGNPLFISKTNRLKELKRELKTALGNLRSTDIIKKEFFRQQINNAEKQLGYLPMAQRQYVSIQRNYALLERLYILLLEKKTEAEISRASTVSELAYINEPRVAGGSLAQSLEKTLIFAFLIGLGIPFAFFSTKELLNSNVQTKEDIEKHTSIPIIGGIGHKKGEITLEVLSNPNSAIAESFRALRSNLSYFTGNKEKAVFLIASSISGEGKSFTAVNLASVFSISGKKTLLVGADLRKPKLHQSFNASNTVGLSSYLAALNSFQDVVQTTQYQNLYFVSGGPIPPNPSELLLQERLNDFMTEAKEEFDFIIIDTPPIAMISDAFPLSVYADHTLFVVRQKYSSKKLLNAVQDYFETGKLKNISIVFNDIYVGIGAVYTDGYKYAYAYGKRDYYK